MTDFAAGLRAHAARLDAEDEAASALWTWLPSHAVAQKHHGDHASEYRPPAADVMREAAMLLAEAKGSPPTPAERAEWFEACPCGGSHADPAPAPGDR